MNRTNVATDLDFQGDEITLADAVVRRERLAREARVLREVVSRATPKQSRYLRTEVKHVPTIDVGALLERADGLSKEHRELDTRIQQANWEVDLLESGE